MRNLFLALGLFAIAGCGASTEEKCQDNCGQTCEGQTAPTADEIALCKTACTQIAAYVKRADCEDQAGALQDCGDQHTCDATVTSQCREQTAALASCLAGFCQSHPDDTDCSS